MEDTTIEGLVVEKTGILADADRFIGFDSEATLNANKTVYINMATMRQNFPALSASGGISVNTLTTTGNASVGGNLALTGDVTTVLNATGGIRLGGTAAANLLNDYEEGTFTPTFTFATAGDLSVTYTQQSGFYRRIGTTLYIDISIDASAFTYTTSAGNLLISGLPFNVLGLCTINFQGVTYSSGCTYLVGQGRGDGNSLQILQDGSNVSRGIISTSNAPSGTTNLSARVGGIFRIS